MPTDITLTFSNGRMTALTRHFDEGQEKDGLQAYCNQFADYHRDRFTDRDKAKDLVKLKKLDVPVLDNIVAEHCPPE